MENLRVRTGIEGLDSFIEGGFPKGRVYLVACSCKGEGCCFRIVKSKLPRHEEGYEKHYNEVQEQRDGYP